MSKEFSLISILDSNNREVFINPMRLFPVKYTYDVNASEVEMNFFSIDASERKKGRRTVDDILINGEPLVVDDLDKSYKICNADNDDYYFLFYAKNLVDLEFGYTVTVKYPNDTDSPDSFYGRVFSTTKAIPNGTELFARSGSCLTDTNSSYQLIRTNPKLSGNIKLVVTSKNELFLDTFKVSDSLTKTMYRHKSVSATSNFNTDVRNVFKTLNSEELYKVPDEDLDAHTSYTDYSQQYQTVYEYGAETNDDELYQENFRLLAPLWMGRVLPDFFVIFRIDEPYNISSYSNVINDSELFDEFLKKGKCVKVFDMRESSPIGKYLHNYMKNINQYPGSVLLQFKEKETQNDYDNGVNSWFGISVESGLVVKKDEISYFANETINMNNQDKLNQFIVDGFERNRLICPNLINLEWMFDDDSVENYKMNRYFGLYMKENDIVTYDFVEECIDPKSKNVRLKKFDENHNEIDDSLIVGENSVLNDEKYDDRMFFAIGSKNFERIKEPNDLTNFLRKEVISKPYKNYQSCRVSKIETSYKNFVTLSLKKPIRYGEHFRIIIPDFSIEGIDSPVVFEFIASNDHRLAGQTDAVSPFISISNSRDSVDDYIYYRQRRDTPEMENIPQEYYYRGVNTPTYKETLAKFPVMKVVNAIQNAGGRRFEIRSREWVDNEDSSSSKSSSSEITKYAYVFRMNFYTQDFIDENNLASVDSQIKRLAACVDAMEKEFGIKLHVESTSNDSISIVTGYNNTYFQHITADILDNDMVEISSKKCDVGKNTSVGVEEGMYTNFKDIYFDDIKNKEMGNDETIVYFGNKDLNIPLVLLDNKTDNFNAESMMFAPVNFEILGWRKTSIVKFLTLEGYSYEIESDDVSKIIPNTIVRGINGKYSRLNDYLISSISFNYSEEVERDYSQYDGILNDINQNIEKFESDLASPLITEKDKDEIRKKLLECKNEKVSVLSYKDNLWKFKDTANISKNGTKELDSYINRVQSPYHLERFIVNSDVDIDFDGDFVSLYSSQPMNISLMGILPIKDFDTTINYTETESFSNVSYLEFNGNTVIYIDNQDYPNSLKKNVMYTLKTGKFKNLPLSTGSSFIIIKEKMYYNSTEKGKLNSFNTLEIKDGKIETANINTPIKITVSPYKIDFDIKKKSPKLEEKYFYKNDDIKNELRYSLVSPCVCNWRGVGNYYDHDSLLKVENILKPDYKSMTKGYFCTFKPNTIVNNNDMFLKNNLDSLVVMEDGEKIDFFSYITKTSITDSINLFLTDGKQPEYTVGYYNKYIDTLDFILYGIKFSLRFNNTDYVSGIQLQNFNKYEIYIVNDYNGNKNDVIINTIENTILIINHNFNFGSFDKKDNNYFARNGKVYKNDFYSWINTDKRLVLEDSESDGESIYIPVNTDTLIPKKVTFEKFVQLDSFNQEDFLFDNQEKNNLIYLDVSVFNDEVNFEDVSVVMTDEFLKYPIKIPYLNNYVNDGEERVMRKTMFGFGSKTVSEHKSWIMNPEYDKNGNDEFVDDEEKFNLMLDAYINTFREDDMNIYIKTQSTEGISVSSLSTNATFKPMNIETSLPKNIKYCIDFYNPNFKNIVEFDINETKDLIKKTKTNFTLSNTKFKKLNRIKNYYGFKIFNKNTINLDNTTNMFVIPERSLVSSNWDYQYYRNYSTANKFTNVDGFLTGIEDKSFFGSKGIKLKDARVYIENWGDAEITMSDSKVSDFSNESSQKTVGNKIIVSINLHRVFFNHFLKSMGENFKSNWKGFDQSSDTAMNNFIKNTLVNYFKINNRQNFRLYSTNRKYDTRLLIKKPSNFETDFEEVKNFESSYRKENNEVILDIVLTDTTKTYYATYDFRSNL